MGGFREGDEKNQNMTVGRGDVICDAICDAIMTQIMIGLFATYY